MCGIAGFFQPGGLPAAGAETVVNGMSAVLSHRGPDDSGHWLDAVAGIALGHRRLSILDLSAAGHQPMVSASGRFVMIFNGEIYDHLELRRDIEQGAAAPLWRGHSDTEILLAGFEAWGIEATLRKAAGMFAFALWDRQQRTLTLARDRMGEKPLYYGWQGGVLLFGSELKALRAHPAFRADIDRRVLAGYFRRGYIAAPHSVYQGIFKLMPGSYLQFSQQEPAPRPRCYWSLREAAAKGLAQPFDAGDAEAIRRLDAELSRAVAQQRIADVPLGAFLSGGVDSSTIVALMQAQSSRPVKTFTIGFHEDQYNEAHHARSVAQQLGTDHTELIVTASEAMEVIPRLASMYDEPFGDSSAIPTFLVSQLARGHVKVALSGDGGDELFAGYARYQRTSDIWTSLRRLPYAVRKTMSVGVAALARRRNKASARATTGRLARYLSARNAAGVYQVQVAQRHDDQAFVLSDGDSLGEAPQDPGFLQEDIYATMMYADASNYLPDDILVKVDRASMAVGLEVRVPMLDHRVLEFAWQVPLQMKVRDGAGKWLLKQVLKKYVPDALPNRPKMGFGVPVGDWVRGPLRDWAESLLGEDRLRRDGLLDPKLAREQWMQHIAGDSSGNDPVWHLLAFQAWLSSVA